MKKHSLTVSKREIFGKKLNKLRKEGILPANIYGKDVKSTAVQLPLKEFEAVYKAAGETGLVDLDVHGEKKPVLIHNVQLDYLTQAPIHADFYQVNLQEKIKTMIPVVLIGEAKAVVDRLGLLLQTLHEIEVEALPTNLPERFEVDVTNLAVVNDQITVEDLKKNPEVEILTDPSQTIAKISELVSQEAQDQAAAEAAASAEAKTETAEGETPATDAKPAAEPAPKENKG